jgi:hypothetical protein
MLELVEAKGNVTKDQLRQAVGQLLDYGRFVEAKTRTVLAPSRPRPHLIDYVKSVHMDVVFPDGDTWVRV